MCLVLCCADTIIYNLQGYLVGNPVTDSKFDKNFVIPASHGFGIISDQLYEVCNSTSTKSSVSFV